jgi:hypothetical protein
MLSLLDAYGMTAHARASWAEALGEGRGPLLRRLDRQLVDAADQMGVAGRD